MDLLAYWRFDNYCRDLDEGAGFHFNSNQSRLHTAINIGERLWLFTRIVIGGESQYRLLAKLVIRSKTINPPNYKYGPYRVWGDLKKSAYYRVTQSSGDDIFELLQLLPFESGTLEDKNRESIAQACQTIRAIKPKASELLEAFSAHLEIETRAWTVADEKHLEKVIYSGSEEQLSLLLKNEHAGVSEHTKQEILTSYKRDRKLVEELNALYGGRCQVTGFDSPLVYGVPTSEAHHIVYRSRGGLDELDNLVLVCPNLHTVIHKTDATFDYRKLAFQFPNRRVEPLVLNFHLKPRSS
jgi:5-methylcytosine-specific restriction protein A